MSNKCKGCAKNISSSKKYCTKQCYWSSTRKRPLKCKGCNNELPKDRKKFCSRECYFEDKGSDLNRKCKNCNKFIPERRPNGRRQHKDKIFCNPRCQREFHLPVPKKCESCESLTFNERFCNSRCWGEHLKIEDRNKKCKQCKKTISEYWDGGRRKGDYISFCSHECYALSRLGKPGVKHSEETKKKLSEMFTGKKLTEEHKEKLRGHGSWCKGMSFGKEYRKKISEGTKKAMQRPEVRKKVMEAIEKREWTDEWKANVTKALEDARKAIENDPQRKKEVNKKVSKGIKKMWDQMSPEKKRRRMKKSIMNSLDLPNKLEEYCIKLFEENNIELTYVGDFSETIKGKSPDFINKEQKIIVEVFSKYFKVKKYGSIDNYIQKRKKIFSEYTCFFYTQKQIYKKGFIDIIKKDIDTVKS